MGDRALPEFNRLLCAREHDRLLCLHQQTLAHSRSTLHVNNENPIEYNHLCDRAKSRQIWSEQQQKIERENVILLEKMRHIMTETQMRIQEPYEKGSLNRNKRIKDMRKILQENEVTNKNKI